MRETLGLLALFAVASPAWGQATDRLNVLVPAYFYPGGATNLGYWDQLRQAAGRVNLTVVINPNNGEFTSANPDFLTQVNTLRAAGATNIGYVYTRVGGVGGPLRDIDAVKANITAYATHYNAANAGNIRGLFIDEMPNAPTPAEQAYYRELYTYVQANHPDFVGRVFGNPGSNTAATAALVAPATRAADRLLVSEMDYATYQSGAAAPAGWIAADADRNRFAHAIHGTGPLTAAGIDQALNLAIERNAGYVYFTDDTLSPNPWDSLPTYWDAFLNRVQVTPVPEPLFGLSVAAAAVAWVRRRRAS